MKTKYFIIFLLLVVNPLFSNGIDFHSTNLTSKKELVLPSATISGPGIVCQNATGVFITLTGTGTGPFTFTYHINTNAPQTIPSGANNFVTLPINTSNVGIITYYLDSVQDATGTQPLNVSTVVNVIPPFTVNAGADILVCRGNPISLTSTVSGNVSPVIYSWAGPNGYTSNQQSPIISSSTTAMSGNYTVTASIGNCQVQDVVNVTVVNVGIANPSTLNACLTSQTSAQIVTILSLPSNPSLIQSISINWGDNPTPQIIQQADWALPIIHNYFPGSYTVTITATTSLGCTIVQTYIAFIGSSPQAATLSLFASQANGCSPHTTNFTFGVPISNSDGTNYVICFGDGSNCINYVDGNTLPPNWIFSGTAAGFNLYTITHIYTATSCGNSVNLNGTTYNNVFLPSVITTNPCTAPQPQAGSLISVGLSPTTSFTPNPIPNVCTNTPLVLNNTSNFGSSIDPLTYTCNSTSPFYWTITPSGSGNWTATGLGSNNGFPNNELVWTIGAMNPSITFTQPGTYTITLIVKNSCGISSVSHNVCVEPPLSPSFTVNTNSGCIPLAITTNNTTVPLNACTPPIYSWSVSYAPSNCGTSSTPIPIQTATNASFNFVEAGTYTITLTATNSCTPPQTTTRVVTVKKPPTVAIGSISDFCGSATLNPSASIPTCALPSILTYAWSFPGGTPSSATSAIPPSVSYATAGNYAITLAVTNECGTTTATSNTFNVLSAPTVQNETLTICSGVLFSITPSTATAGNIIPAGTTYSWSVPTVTGGMTGGAAGTNQNSISGTILNPTSLVQTATYTVTPSLGSCFGNTFTVMVTVNPAAQVNQPAAVSVCNGVTTSAINFMTTNPSGTTFSWTNSTPSIGLAASGNGSIPSFMAVNTTNAPIIATIIVTPSFSGGSAICSGVSKIFTITVNPTGQVNQPANLLKCNGDVVSTTFSTSNISGTTIYNWINDTPTIGLPATGTGNISFTATNSNSTPLMATIIVTPSYNNGSANCVGTSKTFTITINPSAQVNQPTSISVCNGNTIPTTTFSTTNTGGSTSYTWTNSNTAIGLSASGTGDIPSFTALNTGNNVLTATIIVTPSYLIGANFCTGTTKQFTITISPNASVNTIIDKIICNGSNSPSITFTSTNTGGTTSYSWINDTPSIGLAASGTGNIPLFTAVNTGLVPIIATILVTPSFTNGSLVCTAITQTFTITVNPSAQVNSINNIEVCNANAIPSTVFTTNNSGGVTTYSWTNSNTSIGLAASGNGNIPAFTANNTGLTPLIATIIIIPIYTNAGVNCNGTSQSFTIKINPSPTGTISGTVAVCLNATAPQITFTGSAGNPPYIFTYTLNNGTNQTISTTSGNNVSISVPTNALGIFTYNLVNVQDSNATSCLNSISQLATVTVNAAPLIDVSPTPTQIICVGGTVQNPLSVTFINGTGTPTYQWYSNSNTTTTGGIPVGTNSPNYTPPVFTIANTYFYYVVISFSGNGCGIVTSAVAEIVVVNDPVVSTQPIGSQTLCQNITPTTLSVTVSGGIGTSYFYQWYSNIANNNMTGTLILGETNATFIPPTSNVGTTYYYCIVSQTNGLDCNVKTATATVTVNLAPAIATQPVSSTICIGQTPTLLTVSYTNGVGTPQYQWYYNSSNSTTGSTLIIGATNANYNPPNSTFGTTYYYCVITFSSGGCSDITSNIAQVIINQNPIIASQNPIICSGTAFTVTPNNSGGNIVPIGTTYTWTTPTISPAGSITGAMAESNPQTVINQTLINTTTSPATVVYTVIPLSGVCTGANFTITVTVNPSITPNATILNSTCFGGNSGSITTNITGGIPFSSGPAYAISWTGPSGFTSSATTISSLAPGVYNLTVADFGGCPFSNNYTITEPTDIIITTDLEKDITCFGDADGEIQLTTTGGTPPYNLTWTKNTLPFAITEDITNLGPGVYFVSVTDANSCGPRTASFTITEPAVLAVSLVNQTNVLCFGDATGAITITTVGGTPIQISPGVFDYVYSWTGPNGFVSTSQNLTNILAGIYNLTVTDNSGCTKNLTVTITQPTEIIITAVTTPITCYGANNASITVTITGGNPSYQIAWSNLALGLNQNNLSAGNYTITVIDATGCQKVLTINIPQAPVFTTNPIVTQISCFGANNGSINLNLTGGIPTLSLVWADGSPSGLIRNNLGPGTYTYTIVDGTPCTITGSFTLIEPQALVLTANVTNALNCTNANSGAINLVVNGGTPPFNYAWSNGAITEDLTTIPAGNYSVTVTDSRGCIKTGQYSITSPAPIVLTVNTTAVPNCPAFTISQNFSAQFSGGIPPYQFNWSSGIVSGNNSQFMTTNQNGLIILTATDAIGCSANYTFNVNLPVLAAASFNSTSIGYTSYGEFSILDPIQFSNTAVGDFTSILWDFGDGSFSNEENPSHIYVSEGSYTVIQTVTYPYGCTYTHIITLVVKKGYLLVVPTAFTPNNDHLNDTFRPVTRALKEVQMDIYDTWGSLIYSEMGDVLIGWDAKIKDVNAENGNYYCKVSGKTFYGTIVEENHTFVLIK